MRGRKPELKAIAGALSGVPHAPAHFSAEARAEWDAVASDLHERGLLGKAMLGLVETYVVAVVTVRDCSRLLAKEGLTIRTKDGAVKKHPAAALMTQSQIQVLRLGAELGLTPAGRSRKKIRDQERKPNDGFADLDL